MLGEDVTRLKYALLGSTMLLMAGCSSLNPRYAATLQAQTEPNDGKQKKLQTAKAAASHKTALRKQAKPQQTAQQTFLIPTSLKKLLQKPLHKPQEIIPQKINNTLDKVAVHALKQRGTAYRWGGTTPKQGFDCSGLMQYSFKRGANVKIPRTAAAQYAAATKISQEQAQRGDLVFFITRGKKVSHVGLYLGKESFVHAPRTGRNITISKLQGYWKKRLVGFGRIPGACRPILPKSIT